MNTEQEKQINLVYKLAQIEHTLGYMSWNIKDERTSAALDGAIEEIRATRDAARRALGIATH